MLKFLSILYFVLFKVSDAYLDKILDNYITLHPSNFHYRQRRSATDELEKSVISVNLFGQDYKLNLKTDDEIITNDIKVVSIQANNKRIERHIRTNEFYRGYVDGLGKSKSRVSLHRNSDNDGDITASIEIYGKDYIRIEPSWRHLPKSNNYTMIAYKLKNLISNRDNSSRKLRCGFVHADGTDEAAYEENISNETDISHHKRPRRATENEKKNTCKAIIVADYLYYKLIGRNKYVDTITAMLSTITDADEIYRKTNFGNSFTDIGIQVKAIIINEKSDPNSGHYNYLASDWDSSELLKAFGADNSLKLEDYCVGHLFTGVSFKDGVQGMAWIAKSGKTGGICSPGGSSIKYNTGWSTGIDKDGKRMLSLESTLVAAHEFGHNFGSQHDPQNCLLSAKEGGKYLMYYASVSGLDVNNNLFSECSKTSISKVLLSKTCLESRSTSFCGNYKVESGEECDTGKEDDCCSGNCKLKPNAKCSDKNSVCCKSCNIIPKGDNYQCLVSSASACVGNSICDGINVNCPTPANKPDNTSCLDNGKCINGQCQPFCESNSLISCACDTIELSCRVCCKANLNADCIPYEINGVNYVLQNNKACVNGYCNNGECKAIKGSFTDKLWDVIENLSVDLIIKYMKENVIFMVCIVFSAIYLPISIIIACVDFFKRRREHEVDKWKTKKGDQLFIDAEDEKFITKSSGIKSRKNYIYLLNYGKQSNNAIENGTFKAIINEKPKKKKKKSNKVMPSDDEN